jgi:lipopolysaccharide transport system ATP-binding protein
MEGPPEVVMDYYNAMLADRENHAVKQETCQDGAVQTISGTGEAVIDEVQLLDESGQTIDVVGVGQAVALRVKVKCVHAIPELVVGYMIKDRLGQTVFGTNTYHLKRVLVDLAQGQSVELHFEFTANIGIGSYSVAVALHTGDAHLANNYEWRDRVLMFNVVNTKVEDFVGVAWLRTTVRSLP